MSIRVAKAERIDRQAGRHLPVGMGVHFCFGAPLARLDIRLNA